MNKYLNRAADAVKRFSHKMANHPVVLGCMLAFDVCFYVCTITTYIKKQKGRGVSHLSSF